MKKLILPILSLLFAVVIIILKISYPAPITGAAAGLGDFEEVLTISGENRQLVQHIVFDENPPLFCEDGIYIEIDHKSVPFEVRNEIYRDGVCREADVLITAPVSAESVSENETLPENSSGIENITNEPALEIPENLNESLNETNEVTENQSSENTKPEESLAMLTGMAIAEPTAEVKIYYGSAAETPSASIGKDVQIAYKSDSSPELIVLSRDGAVFSKEVTKDELRELAKTAKAIEKDEQVSALLADAVPLVRADEVWNKTVNGNSILGTGFSICIVDTGVDYTHPDLGGCFGAGCKVIGGYDNVNHDSDPVDDNGHGTHVAGIAAANGGIKGIALGANIVALKSLNSAGGGYLSDTITSMKWCTDNSTLYNITAISLSLGTSALYTDYCDSSYPVLASAINDAIAKNITVVVATGNSANYTAIASPACVKNATRVTASDKSDGYAVLANRGSNFLDILVAPGIGINSTKRGGGYVSMNGTSMSTPFVTGLVALLQQHEMLNFNKILTASQVFDAINDNGVSLSDSQSGMSWKRIDAFAAISSLQEAEFSTQVAITIQSPINGAFYKNSAVDFNITANRNLSSAYVSIDSGENMVLLNDIDSHYYNTSVLNEGAHTAAFSAYSIEGNSTTANISFTIDLTNPSVVLISPENNSVIHGGAIILNITDAYLSTVVYYTNKNSTTVVLGNPYSISTVSWPKGGIVLTVIANDSAGNTNQPIFIFNVGNTAPNATAVSVTPATATKASDLTCSYTYSDADGDSEVTSGVNRTAIYWYKNRVLQQNLTSATVKSSNLTKGETWRCAVKTFDGYEFSPLVSSDNNVTILNSVPSVSILYPKTSGERATGTVTVNATVTDADGQSDINAVHFYFTNSTGIFLIGTSVNISTKYEVSWNTSTTHDYNLTRIIVNATDSASTTSGTSDTFIINNINEAPSIILTEPDGNTTLSGIEYIEWRISDADGDLLFNVSIYLSPDGGTTWSLIKNKTAGIGTGTQSWNTATVSNGARYRINVTITDPGGLSASDISDSNFTVTNSAGSGGSSGSAAGESGEASGAPAAAPAADYDITQRFSAISTAVPTKFSVDKEGLALTEVILSVQQTTANAEIKIKKLTEKPADISVTPENAYQYFRIDTTNLSTLASATLKFKVPKSWVNDNVIDYKTVSPKRWASGRWNSLTTSVDREDDSNYYYISVTPSFSVFAITGNKIEVQAAEAEPAEGKTGTLFGKSTGASIFNWQINSDSILLFLVVFTFLLIGLIYAANSRLESKKPKMPQQMQQMPQQMQYPPRQYQYQQPPRQQYQQQRSPQKPWQVFKKPQTPQQKDDGAPDFGF